MEDKSMNSYIECDKCGKLEWVIIKGGNVDRDLEGISFKVYPKDGKYVVEVMPYDAIPFSPFNQEMYLKMVDEYANWVEYAYVR